MASVPNDSQQQANTHETIKAPSNTKRVLVLTCAGHALGTVKQSHIERRVGGWDEGFCTYDGKRVVLALGVSVRYRDPRKLINALDKAYATFCADKNRREQEKQEELTREQKRIETRRQIAERYLLGRSPECREHVLGHMLPDESKETAKIVEIETEANPGLYKEVKSYERIRLATLALANVYDREHSDSTEDLLECAHLFIFDDDVWWESRGCHGQLTHLPYPVCLVEDVLIWDLGDGIKSRAISSGAMEAVSRRMLSYVVNHCVSRTHNNGTVMYAKSMEALPGVVALSSIRGAGEGGTDCRRETQALRGRSPRLHTRRGHWRNQAYGPGMKLHKRIWISDTIVAPGGESYKIAEPSRVHLVTMADVNG